MVKPTILMSGVKTTTEIVILTKLLCKEFNKPNIKFFNEKQIVENIQNKDFNSALSIFKQTFGEFNYFIDELPKDFKAIVNPQNQSVIYDGQKLCLTYLKHYK